MPSWLSGVLAGGLALCSALTAAERTVDDPRIWLQRMADAARTVSHSGELVYAQGDRLDALRIIRLREESNQRERLYSLNGAGREVLREEGKVVRVFPGERAVMVDKTDGRRRLTDITSAQIRELESWYAVSMAGVDRIADRPTMRLRIVPHDEKRYGYTLWLDRETGLLVRSQMHGTEGDVLEEFMYVNLRIGPVEPDAVQSVHALDAYRRIGRKPAARPENGDAWAATYLPEGFELLSDEWWRMPGSPDPVRHLLFGDGLGAVSVYIAPTSGKTFHGQSGSGAIRVAGRVIGDYQVTVMGDVPQQTVTGILQGLERRR